MTLDARRLFELAVAQQVYSSSLELSDEPDERAQQVNRIGEIAEQWVRSEFDRAGEWFDDFQSR